jgi:hypothetical protein
MFAKSYKHYNTIKLALIAIILSLLGHKVHNMAKNTCKNANRVHNRFHARRPKH